MDGAAAALAAVSASLYQRLGGAAGVAAIVDDAVDRHAANPMLAPRFRGHDLPQLKTLGVGFLSAGAGGPRPDAALDAKPVHAGMGFSQDELLAVVGDVAAVLVERGVGATEVGEVVGLFHALKSKAVRR